MRNAITFLTITLLTGIISCSSNKPVVQGKQPEIILIRHPDGDEIENLGNGWFEVVGKAVIQNITPEEAEKKAISKACIKAISDYSGVDIATILKDIQVESQNETIIDFIFSYTHQRIHGRILEKKIIKTWVETDGSNLVKLVRLRVKVGKQKGKMDPGFYVKANLNRKIYKNGDELELEIMPSKDCYITVLNICSDESVYVLFPNRYQLKNFKKGGELTKIPIDLSFRIKLIEGKDRDMEIIKILAIKENMPFGASPTPSPYGTYKSTLKDLQRWLIRIPRNVIEEVNLPYSITK